MKLDAVLVILAARRLDFLVILRLDRGIQYKMEYIRLTLDPGSRSASRHWPG